jgi:hypothetical protein
VEQGLLDLSVELSTRDITAGNEFALFVLVKNPFNSPVWINEVNVSLPSELKLANEDRIKKEAVEAETRFKEAQKESQRERANLEKQIDGLRADLSKLTAQMNGNNKDSQEIARLVDSLEVDAAGLRKKLERLGIGATEIAIRGATIETIKVGSEATTVSIDGKDAPTSINKIEVYAPWLVHEERTQTRTIKLKSSLPENTALQPGSTVVYTATLNVRKSLIFTPSQYRLQFYVNYGFRPKTSTSSGSEGDNREAIFTNTIAHKLSIRPSVYSVLAGSIIGGVAGSIARLLQMNSPITWKESSVSIVLVTILSAIAVIFMARKSDTQSFVSVEDFWGGLLIGFLVGYTGTSFFESLTGVAPPK